MRRHLPLILTLAAVAVAVSILTFWLWPGGGSGTPATSKGERVARPASSRSADTGVLPWSVDATPVPADIQIVSGFDSSPALKTTKLNHSHFAIDFENKFCNWFMFRVEGGEGATVRIDLKNVNLKKWATVNPVYSTVESIDDPASFATHPVIKEATPGRIKATNGPMLPDTSGQAWHFVSNVWQENGTDLCFEFKLPSDRVWVAMRYPYTPGYNERFLAGLEGQPNVEVIELGRTAEDRPLHMVKISGGEEAERRNPCIVMYAREHATEHDSSWVAAGAIRAALSDNKSGLTPDRLTLLIIPLVDPDGAASSTFASLTESYADGRQQPTSEAISTFFKDWILAGKRLDVVLNLHNVESAEMRMLSCPSMEPSFAREEACQTFHKSFVRPIVEADGFVVNKRVRGRGTRNFRLSGYLRRMYGAFALPYEANVQDPGRHLTLDEAQRLGEGLAVASVEFAESSEGASVFREIRQQQSARVAKWERLQPFRDTLKRLKHDGISEEEWLNCRE